MLRNTKNILNCMLGDCVELQNYISYLNPKALRILRDLNDNIIELNNSFKERE